MRTEKVSSQSSDKLMQILECLAEQKLPMRLQDLAEAVGMTQPTVLRYLNSLVNSNYIYQDPESLRYGLTWKVCALGANLGSYASMRSIANRFVTQLSMRFGLGACLVVEENGSCVYLDCIDSSPVAGRILQHIGRRSPLHTASSGKILLASHSDEEVDRYIAEKGLERLTDNTITSREVAPASQLHGRRCRRHERVRRRLGDDSGAHRKRHPAPSHRGDGRDIPPARLAGSGQIMACFTQKKSGDCKVSGLFCCF